MRASTATLGVVTVVAGLAYLATTHFLAGWAFAYSGLLYCISGVGPLVDRWDAKRRRMDE
jgi:thiosulfate reductase cytochrome b subunit